MSRAAPCLNGQPIAAAPAPRLIVVGARGLTWSVVIQLAVAFVGLNRYFDVLRSEVREGKVSTDLRLDAIDRRLSKLDGVPR
jgi:hypothetical protein